MYRVNTKELYTFKMIQKTNAAYLELHTYTSGQKKHSKVLFQMARVIVVVARLH
jgi:hypothetical protein